MKRLINILDEMERNNISEIRADENNERVKIITFTEGVTFKNLILFFGDSLNNAYVNFSVVENGVGGIEIKLHLKDLKISLNRVSNANMYEEIEEAMMKHGLDWFNQLRAKLEMENRKIDGALEASKVEIPF